MKQMSRGKGWAKPARQRKYLVGRKLGSPTMRRFTPLQKPMAPAPGSALSRIMSPGLYGMSEWGSPPKSTIKGTIHGMPASDWMRGATKWWASTPPRAKDISLTSERRNQNFLAGHKDALWTRPHVSPKNTTTRNLMARTLRDMRRGNNRPGYLKGYQAGLRLAHNKQNAIWSRRPKRAYPKGLSGYNANQPRDWMGRWAKR